MKTTRTLIWLLVLALLAIVLLTLPISTAHADAPVVRVKVGGATGEPCGGAWETACDLQYALTSTVGAAELWVAAGTYTPTMGITRTATFHLVDGVALYGGFAMTETLRSQRNFAANITILSGDLNGDDNSNAGAYEPTSDDNAYHVVTGSGTNSTAILDGFTVTRGIADVVDQFAPHSRGAGMYNDSGSPTVRNVIFFGNYAEYFGAGMQNSNTSSPTLLNVTFSDNGAHDFGGGMYNESNSNPTLIDVTFSGNSATAIGGGMYDDGSSPTLTNVTFSSNSSYYGGGMYGWNSSPTLTNVTFSGNSAGERGGGMVNDSDSSPTLTNVTFGGNSAGYAGGAMINWSGSMPALTNVTFSGNSAGTYGGGIANVLSSPTLTNVTFSGNWANGSGGAMYNTSSDPTVRNAVLWGNTAPSDSQIGNDDTSTASLSDSVVQGGYTGGTNIITTDPLLGALGDWGGATQTIRLLRGSSAIDAGNNAICPPTDQRGKTRVGVCDIGAFEFQGYALTKTGGDQQSALINTPFASSLEVTLTEIDSGQLLPDIVVTFAAPPSGASAAWSGSLVQTATTNASGVATVAPPTANGIVGSYTVTAVTAGAVSPAAFTLTNFKYATTTTLTSSANPSVVGQTVTLTATVSGASPSGSVAFKDGGATLAACAAVPLSGGSAACTLASPTLGTHAITAAYSGDANNHSSSGALTQVVNTAGTTTVITSSQNPVLASHAVTLTVTVSALAPASSTPTGTVELSETSPAAAAVRATRRALASQPLVDGVATFSLPSLSPGTHTFLATYSGDANNNASTSAIYTQIVGLLYDYLPLLRK